MHGYMNKPLKYKAVTVAAVVAHGTEVGQRPWKAEGVLKEKIVMPEQEA